jgi:glycosyltransferase involved in cell wall biosynthesis
VVDDGSTDDTELIVQSLQGVKYLRNEQNQGKGYSLDRAVKNTISPIIFFCDADLEGVTAEHLSEIINPVVDGSYPMFIGVRKNIMQNTMRLVALNSGERALRREIWEYLPNRYKVGFRIEIALNVFVRRHYGGFGYRKLRYYQTVKEQKYGIIKGMSQRIKMTYDVLFSWFLIAVGDRVRSVYRKRILNNLQEIK